MKDSLKTRVAQRQGMAGTVKGTGATGANFVNNRDSAAAQLKMAGLMENGPHGVGQRKQMEAITDAPAQRMGGEEEEPLQGKADPLQRAGAEEEEPLQGKADPLQRAGAEEEEPLQGKTDPLQRAGAEEEEPLQGKADPLQRAGAEEEPLQGKAIAGRRA